jgi:hypothetical protein
MTTMTLSTIGKVPIDANETVWLLVRVVFDPSRGGHRVQITVEPDGPIVMGSDAAASVGALLRVADEKCREAAEFALRANRNRN